MQWHEIRESFMFSFARGVFGAMFHFSALVDIYFNLVCPTLLDHKTRLLLFLTGFVFCRLCTFLRHM